MFKRLNQNLIDTVAQQASSSDRLRQSYNFHTLEEKVQRSLICLQPGTYVRPHRHKRAIGNNGFELCLILQGAVGMLLFNDQGAIIHQEQISADGTTSGIELREGTYHTLIALLPNTVIFEVKEGPYDSTTDKEFLPFFPLEGTIAAEKLVQTWHSYFVSPI